MPEGWMGNGKTTAALGHSEWHSGWLVDFSSLLHIKALREVF